MLMVALRRRRVAVLLLLRRRRVAMLLWRRRICPRLARRRTPATTAANVGITSRGWPLERRHTWVVVAQVHAMPGACCSWNPEEARHMSTGPVLVPELRRWRDISVLYD